ncbi:hypothetical protein N9H60_01085 [Flavimaricola sp.]|nr:hypothetical protein [Flavimaricola sp.]MDA9019757.1 hypothetical protein [Flavimaricola sp.]
MSANPNTAGTGDDRKSPDHGAVKPAAPVLPMVSPGDVAKAKPTPNNKPAQQNEQQKKAKLRELEARD